MRITLAFALRGLRSGKGTPKKVLFHPKLPDQDQVRRIFKAVESHDERIELNLYIVGEESEESEGIITEDAFEEAK